MGSTWEGFNGRRLVMEDAVFLVAERILAVTADKSVENFLEQTGVFETRKNRSFFQVRSASGHTYDVSFIVRPATKVRLVDAGFARQTVMHSHRITACAHRQ